MNRSFHWSFKSASPPHMVWKLFFRSGAQNR